MLFLKKTVFSHHKKIIDILCENVSNYKPHKNLKNIWRNFKKQKNIFCISAIDKRNEVLGYGSIVFEYKIRGGLVGHIEDIAVQKKYQKKGIGTKIIKKLIQEASKKKCYKVILQTKNAKNFYKKLGFKKNGETLQKFF